MPHSSEPKVLSNVSKALKDGKCILATHEHITFPNFPISDFQVVIEYSEAKPTCNVKRSESNKWITLRTKNPLRVGLNLRDGPGDAIKEGNAEIKPALDGCSQDEGRIPIVVSDQGESLFNRRRHLFESLLGLEREGALVVHRDLGLLVDAAFPPSSVLCLWEINTNITDTQVRYYNSFMKRNMIIDVKVQIGLVKLLWHSIWATLTMLNDWQVAVIADPSPICWQIKITLQEKMKYFLQPT